MVETDEYPEVVRLSISRQGVWNRVHCLDGRSPIDPTMQLRASLAEPVYAETENTFFGSRFTGRLSVSVLHAAVFSP